MRLNSRLFIANVNDVNSADKFDVRPRDSLNITLAVLHHWPQATVSGLDWSRIIPPEERIDGEMSGGRNLGHGHYGTLWQVERMYSKQNNGTIPPGQHQKRFYARKILHAVSYYNKPLWMDHVVREVAVLMHMRSPWMPTLRRIDIREDIGSVYLFMDLMATDLKVLVDVVTCRENGGNGEGYITEAEAVWYIRDIVRGIEHLHSWNTAHLDLEKQNILINEEGHAVVS